MNIIEREWRFLVLECPVIESVPGIPIKQAYLSNGFFTVRARIYGEKGFLTIKHALETSDSEGAALRHEFEYEIPLTDAEQMIAKSNQIITKKRYRLHNGLEIDIFSGELQGLVLAEWEMEEGDEPAPPDGIVWKNISQDHRYSNRCMSELGMPSDAIMAKINKKANI